MPDERLDSMRQGIAAPPESPEAQQAEKVRKEELVRNPMPVEMESVMGGTSDAERAGDQADMDAALNRGLPNDRTRATGGTDDEA